MATILIKDYTSGHYPNHMWHIDNVSHHSKRPKVLAALESAMAQFKLYPGATTATTATAKPPLMKWSGKA
jgi:hypothetical protein